MCIRDRMYAEDRDFVRLHVKDNGSGISKDKQKTAYEISECDWSSDVCSSDLFPGGHNEAPAIFKKDGTYWMITSGCTGWAPNAARPVSYTHLMTTFIR